MLDSVSATVSFSALLECDLESAWDVAFVEDKGPIVSSNDENNGCNEINFDLRVVFGSNFESIRCIEVCLVDDIGDDTNVRD